MFKQICSRLLKDDTQLYLLDLQNETMHFVDVDFLESYNEYLPEGENITHWCAKHAKECVHEQDRKAFIDFLNPYELTKRLKKTPAIFLYFQNNEEEWRHITIKTFEGQFVILKIKKVELSDLAVRLVRTARELDDAPAKIKAAKDFQALQEEFKKYTPASIGLVYLKSKNSKSLFKAKQILTKVFEKDNCYELNKQTILALIVDESSCNFQNRVIDLYAQLEDEELNISSHWTCDEDEEIPFIMDKAIHKIING